MAIILSTIITTVSLSGPVIGAQTSTDTEEPVTVKSEEITEEYEEAEESGNLETVDEEYNTEEMDPDASEMEESSSESESDSGTGLDSDKKIETYFIHCNNDTGYKNSKYGNFKINTFYPFKPTFTGTLREYLLSSSAPSCLGYIKNGNDINIEFNSNQEYTYFNKKMLEEIQSGCLEFIDDFKKNFEGYTDLIELNNYYMSIPFEYYLHYSKQVDRTIFSHLKFEKHQKYNHSYFIQANPVYYQFNIS